MAVNSCCREQQCLSSTLFDFIAARLLFTTCRWGAQVEWSARQTADPEASGLSQRVMSSGSDMTWGTVFTNFTSPTEMKHPQVRCLPIRTFGHEHIPSFSEFSCISFTCLLKKIRWDDHIPSSWKRILTVEIFFADTYCCSTDCFNYHITNFSLLFSKKDTNSGGVPFSKVCHIWL